MVDDNNLSAQIASLRRVPGAGPAQERSERCQKRLSLELPVAAITPPDAQSSIDVEEEPACRLSIMRSWPRGWISRDARLPFHVSGHTSPSDICAVCSRALPVPGRS